MEFKIVENVEAIELISFINRKKKLHQKLILDAVEQLIEDPELFSALRKIILDNTSDFSRSVVRVIFGDDFEGYIK